MNESDNNGAGPRGIARHELNANGRGPTRREMLRSTLASAALLATGAVPLHALAFSGDDDATVIRRDDDAGSAQPTHGGDRAERHLDTALAAARWIARHARRTAAGLTWPVAPDISADARADLYHGSPGVVLFLLELHAATGDEAHLTSALAGADELAAGTIPRMLASGNLGLYTGAAGVAYTLHEAYRASGAARFREASRLAVTGISGALTSAAAGAPSAAVTDIIAGLAGTGLTLLTLGPALRINGATTAAAAAGRQLLAVAIPERGGSKWPMQPGQPRLYPNFSHGTAGVAYFLSELYRATREPAFLEGAQAGATYLDAVATRTNGGALVFHHEPGGEDLFYLGWCHGPVGTARLYRSLAAATGDEAWFDHVAAAAAGIVASGVPERRSAGYWNNVSRCCGDAGVGDFFLSLHRELLDAAHLRMANRCADYLIAQATRDGDGLKWIQAEHRVRPDETVAQTGLMQGAAGVGLFMLRRDALVRGREPLVRLPDTPFA